MKPTGFVAVWLAVQLSSASARAEHSERPDVASVRTALQKSRLMDAFIPCASKPTPPILSTISGAKRVQTPRKCGLTPFLQIASFRFPQNGGDPYATHHFSARGKQIRRADARGRVVQRPRLQHRHAQRRAHPG